MRKIILSFFQTAETNTVKFASSAMLISTLLILGLFMIPHPEIQASGMSYELFYRIVIVLDVVIVFVLFCAIFHGIYYANGGRAGPFSGIYLLVLYILGGDDG